MGEEDGRPDMVNRDPNSLNQSLVTTFEDVFGEPETAHSPDCAWKCGYKCYEGAKGCCYQVLAYLCIWFYAFCWGCEFACVTFNYIWVCTPTMHMMKLVCGTCQGLLTTCLECAIGPCCSTCGLMFSQIKVQQG